jgi:protein tyrosine phosphatase (PTP) superfamily phosphohydrolase (DUF442 family)
MTDPNDIMNWRRLDARVTTSGQPTTTQLVEIADLGVVHVINLGLHTHPHALADERGDVERLGMKYTHIPVDFAAPTDEDFEKFQKAFESTSPDKVHVHCIFNWRVSAFFYRYQRYVLNMDEATARATMDSIWEPKGVWSDFVLRGPRQA